MRKLIAILVLSASLALAAPSSVVVQSGDTLGSIAARNGVSVQALLKANGLSATNTLKIGQVLKIPGSGNQKTGSITVQSGDTLGSIANRYGISVATLKAINGLSGDSVSVGQVLRLSGSSVKQNKASTVNPQTKAKSGTVIVQSGDSLGKIALQNNTTVAALKAANGLNSNDLKLGQVLKLPGSSNTTTTAKNSSDTTKSSNGTVTVKAGDTLGEIAQANNMTIAKLKAVNGLSGNDLKLGQVLKLSNSSGNASNSSVKTSAPTTSKTSKSTVTVKAGDSLSKIAQNNGTTIAALRAANGLSSDDLKLGQVLKLPNGGTAKASNSSDKTKVTKTPSTPAVVKVQKGDSLSKIATQYGLSVESLRKLNNLKSDDLALGQTLKLKAPVIAKTNKPSKSTSSTAKTDKTIAKNNQNKPVTSSKSTKPSTKATTTSSKPSTATSKTTSSTTTKANSTTTTSKSSTTTSSKTSTSKPETSQKPATTKSPSTATAKPSGSTTKPTTAAQDTPKPAPVAVKPTPAKPETVVAKPTSVKPTVAVTKPTPQPTTPVATVPTQKPSSPKPTQPTVNTQPSKPAMNEATVPETEVQSNPVTTTEPTNTTSDAASSTSSTPTTTEASSSDSTDVSTVPQPETDQSQSGVGSDADYIIIEPQNSLEVVGQRTGSVASTTPAKLPTNTTPQQRVKYTRERLLWPLQGVLTSYYGYRSLRIGRSHFHTGLDIAAPRGTPVYAALSGRVEQAGWSRVGYGKLVIIRGWDGRRYYYGHNSRLLVKAGQWVNQGTLISRVGSTGYATGPHLHFEVRVGGHTRNPLAYLPRSQVQFARYAPKR
jgi:LysM repeat protein